FCDAMSMVEVRHRASEALQKPSLHETAGDEFRLWRFDRVGCRCFERRQGADVWRVGGKFGVCGRCGLLAGDSVGSIGTRKPQRDADWVTGGCCHQYGGMGGFLEGEGSREVPGYKTSNFRGW